MQYVEGLNGETARRSRYPRRRSDPIARALVSGDRHTAPSIPDVSLPALSVTCFTAKARPEKEWVSHHCRAFARPWRPSRVA